MVPSGFVPCLINGIPCYHNQQQRLGTSWDSDGSKLTDDQTRVARAGAAATCGPPQIISRVTGPQDSYHSQLQGSVIVTKCARPTDTLPLDNKVVVDYRPLEPTRECTDMDLRRQLHDNLTSAPILVHWIAGHQTVRASHTAQQKADIKRNHEVDRLAKKASTFTTTRHTADRRVADTRRRRTCTHTGQKVDTPQEDVAEIHGSTLGFVAALQRGTTSILAPVVMGQRALGWM